MINSRNLNTANGGMVCKSENEIFVSDIERFTGIFKISANGVKKIYDRAGCFLNISGDKLFFLDRGKKNGVMKYDMTFDTVSCIFEQSMWNMYLEDETLFYLDEDKDFQLFKINLNGAGKVKISGSACSAFYIDGSILFYSQEDGIYQTDISEQAKKKISDRHAAEILVYESELYFTDIDNGNKLTQLSLRSGSENVVTDFFTCSLNGTESTVFFANQTENNSIYIMKANSNQSMKFLNEHAEHIHVLEDEIIYCANKDGNSKCWNKLSIRGGRPIPLFNILEVI